MPLNVETVREEFPILQRKFHDKPLVFLDSAASSQKPRAVIDAVANVWCHSYANVHRGLYALAEEATEAYEAARTKVAAFIHAPEPAEVIFVRNATEALNLLVYSWGESNVEAGDRIVVTELEHHANLVPWQQLAKRKGAELVYVPVTDEGFLDLDVLTSLLKGGRVRVVACSAMSNVLGTTPPVAEIARQAHDAGALVVVDGAQAVPHFPVDVQALGADFLAFSGHKMCGPGVGVLWGRRQLLQAMPPFLFGGEMIRSVRWEASTWNDLPYKFEAGTPPIAEAIGLGVAVDFLSEIGMEAIHEHERSLVIYAMERLAGIPGLQILGPGAPHRGGVVSFWLDGTHPHDVAAILDEEGICVRAGHHCAQPLHERFGIPASTRASFYLYNDEADVDRLVAGLLTVRKVLGLQ